jgi:hypothetical protein
MSTPKNKKIEDEKVKLENEKENKKKEEEKW